jgi:hypothetical protein
VYKLEIFMSFRALSLVSVVALAVLGNSETVYGQPRKAVTNNSTSVVVRPQELVNELSKVVALDPAQTICRCTCVAYEHRGQSKSIIHKKHFDYDEIKEKAQCEHKLGVECAVKHPTEGELDIPGYLEDCHLVDVLKVQSKSK